MSEIWRPVPGYEGLYEVSDQGRVRSYRRREVHILRPGKMDKGGHLGVVLTKRKSKYVHALVLLAFTGPPPPHTECLHRNHNPADNRLENLYYGTRGENIKQDYDRGVFRGCSRTLSRTPGGRDRICALRKQGLTLAEISKRTGWSFGFIGRVVRGEV